LDPAGEPGWADAWAAYRAVLDSRLYTPNNERLAALPSFVDTFNLWHPPTSLGDGERVRQPSFDLSAGWVPA
jgi:hypothetical protein